MNRVNQGRPVREILGGGTLPQKPQGFGPYIKLYIWVGCLRKERRKKTVSENFTFFCFYGQFLTQQNKNKQFIFCQFYFCQKTLAKNKQIFFIDKNAWGFRQISKGTVGSSFEIHLTEQPGEYCATVEPVEPVDWQAFRRNRQAFLRNRSTDRPVTIWKPKMQNR